MHKRIMTKVTKRHIQQLNQAMKVILKNNYLTADEDEVIASLDMMQFVERGIVYVTLCDIQGNMLMTIVEERSSIKDDEDE